MRALVYDLHPLRWATCRLIRTVWPGCAFSTLGGLSLKDVAEAELPGPDWAIVRPVLAGICGSDLAVLRQSHPPHSILQAYSSFPMRLGHENVSIVQSVGSGVEQSWIGRRVCVEPTLCCSVRGIDPPCRPCREGQFGACENFDGGPGDKKLLPAGTSIGYTAATGAFADRFVAHRSQLVAVPEAMSDEQAVLVDCLACGMHAVLRAELGEAERVLVYGAGSLALGVVGGLRCRGYAGTIHVIARHGYQGELARKAGADDVLALPDDRASRFAAVAAACGARARRARFDNWMLSGGYDVVFDCVGSRGSLDESLKWARSRGQVILVGTGAGPVDATPIWFTELTVRGAYGRSIEHVAGRDISTYELVMEDIVSGRLGTSGLLTHRFALSDYRAAFAVAAGKARHRAVKVAFEFGGERDG